MNNRTVAALESSAKSYAERIEPDSRLNAFLSQEAERIDESKRCPVRIKIELDKIFGDDIDNLPEPGTMGGNNPDIIEENQQGKKTMKKVSWWKTFAHSIPFVAKEQKYLDALANALSKSPDPAIAGNLVSKPEGWLKGEQANQRQRVNRATAIVTMAGELIFQEQRLSEYPNVSFSYNMEKNSEGVADFVRGSRTYVLKHLDEKGVPTGATAYFSAGEFLQLNVDRAIEKGSTWESLLFSRKRESQPADLAANVRTPEKLDEFITSIWHFFQSKTAIEKAVTYLCKEENASARRAFQDVYIALDTVMTTPKVSRLTAKTLGEEEEEEKKEKVA